VTEFLALEASSGFYHFLSDIYMFPFNEEPTLYRRVGRKSVGESQNDVGHLLVFVSEVRWFDVL
jgi:hypothetical protein